ncbi:hypothetical protein OSCT_1560 [Oscillochloris trichoides DG-6]|uniref:Uncharacterized protein n=1 Tax=Oscillochloris trichoides DG-6 TaxID=765420 RepID=E1IE09_9CHLR|nr:hypothetical protein [Oscillochloris trichoides]EFO80620.1 hypothetical protein OSCT_1560 [Oscillochloris trichoides DG-6]
MEDRNTHLTPEDLLVAAEAETRRLLARYGQPAPIEPPPDLAGRVIAALATPRPSPTSRLRRIYGTVVSVFFLALISLGSWGILLDSRGPANLFADLSSGLGDFFLFLTLAAKPLINLLLTAGAATLAIIGVVIAGGWIWWQLVHYEGRVRLEAHL